MDIKHTPFPSGLVMTPSGGLEYLKMPVGLVQGPNGELIPTASAHPTLGKDLRALWILAPIT